MSHRDNPLGIQNMFTTIASEVMIVKKISTQSLVYGEDYCNNMLEARKLN